MDKSRTPHKVLEVQVEGEERGENLLDITRNDSETISQENINDKV